MNYSNYKKSGAVFKNRGNILAVHEKGYLEMQDKKKPR